jgi:hypothetical protein
MVVRWWAAFQVHNSFPHPQGQEATTNSFLDLHWKFVKYCISNLSDLTITLASNYITETITPALLN